MSTNVQSEIYPTTTTATTTIKEQTLNKYKNKRKIHFRIAPQRHKDNDDEQQKHKLYWSICTTILVAGAVQKQQQQKFTEENTAIQTRKDYLGDRYTIMWWRSRGGWSVGRSYLFMLVDRKCTLRDINKCTIQTNNRTNSTM